MTIISLRLAIFLAVCVHLLAFVVKRRACKSQISITTRDFHLQEF